MPQVHSKQRLLDQDPSAFSKNSRYMASLKFTEGSLRRMNALNTMDKRLTRIRMNYFERHADIQMKKYERAKNRIIDKIQKNLAYKLVLKQHSIANAKDYQKALKGNYSFHALQYEVNDMLQYVQPDLVRERRARALIDVNRRRYEELLSKNQEQGAILFPMKKTWEAFDFSKIKAKDNTEDDEKSQGGESVISPLPKIDPRRGRLLGRRIIEEPETKPNSPKTRSAKRQGITMDMMKKQKSFLDNQKSFIENQEKLTHLENSVQDHKDTTTTVSDSAKQSDRDRANDVQKSVENNAVDSKNTNVRRLSLPPIKPKGASKFMQPKVAPKTDNLLQKPKQSSKVKLPTLKLKNQPPVLEEIAVQG